MKSFVLFTLVILCICVLSATAQEYGTYVIALTPENQSTLQQLRNNQIGACNTDPSYVGSVNTVNGILVMVATASPLTLSEFETTSACGKALLANQFATQYTIPQSKTSLELQTECWVNDEAKCGADNSSTTTSLCPCSNEQNGVFYIALTSQSTLDTVLHTNTGECYNNDIIKANINTINGIIVHVKSTIGTTVWNFEQTTCGTKLKSLTTKDVVIGTNADPVVTQCFPTPTTSTCSTTESSPCECTPSVEFVTIIEPSKVTQGAPLFATGGICHRPNPEQFALVDDLATYNGTMVYIVTNPGFTKYNFDSSTCGQELSKLTPTLVDDEHTAEHIIDDCWAHGDHGHCGSKSCLCPQPASLNITPVVFELNITHTQSEGTLYFNNYFIPTMRLREHGCRFSRYLATYDDGYGYKLRLYIDNLPATCTKEAIDKIITLSFQSYYAKALERYNNGGGDDHDHGDDHSGHNHFQMLAEKATGPVVAGITEFTIEAVIALDPEHCWNYLTNGLKCIAEDKDCNIKCALETHCTSNDQCGTNYCGEHEHDHDDDHAHDDDDDHSGHNHFKLTSLFSSLVSPHKRLNLIAYDHSHDHTEEEDRVCQVQPNNTIQHYSAVMMVVSVIVATFFF